ncbi:MAG: hypothetical protein A3F12_04410 [Gammaproteobacteria bacterium RIFCSPHIGHO2_12_FULL_38_14]|nr:MAG: hypothetical protein A3F12_04410 [Gammaproteobacteria bacterium RIFCSPHIGHO2_12_FULL_38_14]
MRYVGFFIFLLFLTHFSYAEEPAPTICPSVKAIRSVGVNKSRSGYPFANFIVTHDPIVPYDTEQPWELSMFMDDWFESDAMKNAKKGLENLEFTSGPIHEDWGGYDKWTCNYQTHYAKEVVMEFYRLKINRS